MPNIEWLDPWAVSEAMGISRSDIYAAAKLPRFAAHTRRNAAGHYLFHPDILQDKRWWHTVGNPRDKWVWPETEKRMRQYV